jgi:hypothetical protein
MCSRVFIHEKASHGVTTIAHINASILAFVLEITSPSWDDKFHEVRGFFQADGGTNALHDAARSIGRSNKRKSCGM